MLKDNSKDICSRENKINFAFLSLISNKISVGIIGAGRAGLIKAEHFLKENCHVEVITREKFEHNEKVQYLSKESNFKISCCDYSTDFIKDKHLVIIAVDNLETRDKIKKDCDSLYKIYIDCTNFREGLAVVPVQRETENLCIGINTKGGNPRGSVFIADRINKDISNYDGFIAYTTFLRNKFKSKEKEKDSALKFILSEDFYFFYKKNKADKIIKLFYNEV